MSATNSKTTSPRKSRAAEVEGRGVTLDDFVAYMPSHSYIFTPCREIWRGASVNCRLPRVSGARPARQPKRDANGKLVTMSPATWLDQNRPVEQMTWCPACRC